MATIEGFGCLVSISLRKIFVLDRRPYPYEPSVINQNLVLVARSQNKDSRTIFEHPHRNACVTEHGGEIQRNLVLQPLFSWSASRMKGEAVKDIVLS